MREVRASLGALDRRVRYVLGLLVLVALYDGAAQLSYAVGFAGPVASIVWLPVGVGIAFLYLGGLRYWPAVMAGDLLANNYSTLPVFPSGIGQSLGNLAEVVVAVWLIQRMVPNRRPLLSVRGLGGLLTGIGVGTALSATVGTLSLRAGDVIGTSDMTTVWRTWWLGDGAGALLVVPLVLAWRPPIHLLRGALHRVEALALAVTVVVSTNVASMSHEPLTYLALPALAWAALRFGNRGATLALAATAWITLWNTVNENGAFAFNSITRSILTVQLFIVIAALGTLCLAVVVTERERYASGLQASRARLVESADQARRRLERSLHAGPQQRLILLSWELEQAATTLHTSPAEAETALENARVHLGLAISELREFANGIHPSVLTQLGLATALRSAAPRSEVPIELLAVPETRLDQTAEVTAYQVFAEAVTNAQRHADASSISVRATTHNGLLQIEVVDDGIGGAEEDRGSGLRSLRDRVETVGGKLRIESPEGRGTRVVADIPAAAAAAR
jgi:signal transduction histidine kinase